MSTNTSGFEYAFYIGINLSGILYGLCSFTLRYTQLTLSRIGTHNLWHDPASHLQEGQPKFPQEQKVLYHL